MQVVILAAFAAMFAGVARGGTLLDLTASVSTWDDGIPLGCRKLHFGVMENGKNTWIA